jgi:integrase
MRYTKCQLIPLKQGTTPGAKTPPPNKAWCVYFHRTDVDGKLKLSRRFFSNKADAQVFCSEKKAELSSLGNQAQGLSDELKREALACHQKLKPFGKSLTDAVGYFIRDMETLHKSVTVSQATTELIKRSKADGQSDRHIQAISQTLNNFGKLYGKDIVSTIRTDKVQAWLDGYRTKEGNPLSAVSFNTYRRYLGLFFSFCVKQGWTESNPLQRVNTKNTRNKVPRLLTPSDLRQILEAANDSVRPALALQAFCGLRAAEVARLEWSDLLPSGHIQIGSDKAKTGRRRLTPAPALLLKYLISIRKPSGYIFGEGKGGNVGTLQVAMKEVRESLQDLKWGRNALRASALSYRLAETKDAAATALEMGNSPTVLLRDYRELTTAEEAKSWFKVDPADPAGGGVISISA